MANQEIQLQELFNGMNKLLEASKLNQQEISAFKAQLTTLTQTVETLTQEVEGIKAQNELTKSHFCELYKTQSKEELLEKMSSIGKDAVKADECTVYGADDEKGQEALKKTKDVTGFFAENGGYTMIVPLEDQHGDIIGVVEAKRSGEGFKEADAKVFNLNEGELGTIFRASLEQKIAKSIAVTDKLTRLKNRDGMSSFIKNEVLARVQEDKPVSAIMFDIDHFKRFNDTYGHDIGDRCLKLVADTIKSNVRVSDSEVFRWGGEEMIVILPVTEERAFTIAERIRIAVEAASLVVDDKTGETTQVTVSGGISEFVPKSIELDKNRIEAAFERCLKEADNSLYDAKEHGRNRIYGSETLMQDHRSLPSPTELFQHWYDRHTHSPNQDLVLLTANVGENDTHWVVVNHTPNDPAKEPTPTCTHNYVGNDNLVQTNKSCIEDIMRTKAFYFDVRDTLRAIVPDFSRREELYDQEELRIEDGLDDKLRFAKVATLALVNEWERVKDTLSEDMLREYAADIEALKAMVYTPDVINIKEIIDERKEAVLDNLNTQLSKEAKGEWWDDFEKKCREDLNSTAESPKKDDSKSYEEELYANNACWVERHSEDHIEAHFGLKASNDLLKNWLERSELPYNNGFETAQECLDYVGESNKRGISADIFISLDACGSEVALELDIYDATNSNIGGSFPIKDLSDEEKVELLSIAEKNGNKITKENDRGEDVLERISALKDTLQGKIQEKSKEAHKEKKSDKDYGER